MISRADQVSSGIGSVSTEDMKPLQKAELLTERDVYKLHCIAWDELAMRSSLTDETDAYRPRSHKVAV